MKCSSKLADIAQNIMAFRQHYPEGKNYVVASDITSSFEKKYENINIQFVSCQNLLKNIVILFSYKNFIIEVFI